MQQINTEQQRASARLLQQLPANKINETTTNFTHSQHVNKNSKSSARRLQTDLADFDTSRSLSTVPTYSSLSRHSPETRECATQITTLTPTEIVEDSQETSDDSPLPIDDQPVFFLEETELMPLSSGFGAYPHLQRTQSAPRFIPLRTKPRDPQYRLKQREKNWNSLTSNSKSLSTDQLPPPPRPTAVRRSPPPDKLTIPKKRQETNPKIPKNDSVPNGFRRIPPKEPVVRDPSPPAERRRIEPMRKSVVTNSPSKYPSSPDIPQDFGRKPVRLHTNDNAYHPSPASSVVYQKPAPLPQDVSDKPRLLRVANSDYIVERRRQPPEPVYDDYHTDSYIERPRQKRLVRVVQDPPYQEDDDAYYVESPRSRRIPVTQKQQPAEYVYVDDPPAQVRRRRRAPPPPPPRHSGAYYVDEDQPADHEGEYIYVDEDGNEVEVVNERNHSPEYVQYIYDDEKDKRRSHKQKVIYVDDDRASNHGREKIRSKHPSSTRIVYE